MYDEYDNNRLLRTGDYVGLKFEQGWAFMHVLETETIDLKPWILLNEEEEREAIPPGEAGSRDDEIRDEVNRRLVSPRDSNKNQVFQIQVGIGEDRMQLYPTFGRDRAPNLTGGAEPGSPQVPVTGYDSPYNDPSKRGEFFKLNNLEDLALQAYNPTSEPLEARISVSVNKFTYAVLEDIDMMRGFLQGQIPWKSHTVGLGVRTNDQLKAPGWFMQRFGDEVLTTTEILESGNDVGTRAAGEVPDLQGGGN